MKTVAQVKKEALSHSKVPDLFTIDVQRLYAKTYEVKMVCGSWDDYQRFIRLMKREGYTIFY